MIFLASALTGVLLVDGRASADGASTPHWEELKSELSDDSFQVANVDDWVDQCVRPFADSPIEDAYAIFEKPSGLCMHWATCAYEACQGPFPSLDKPNWWEWLFSRDTYNSSNIPDEAWKSYEGLNLPAAVVHPRHVGDISATIKFAIDHDIGISVKTGGNSFSGASTKKDTILLHLSKLQKYSPDGSIVECADSGVPEGAYKEACDLALARNKDAVLRVGGGEIFTEALTAVDIDWNESHDNKYHLVSGGAGAVSAAGGWLASGGLSGTNGMRMYGMGVDQVLHVEMVLPSGMHVRFGPTAWEEQDGRMYHLTTEVTGYCNMGILSDEESWDWQKCEEDINFSDLWYAVRGGGGGTFGVVTSIYYQLHEYSPMQFIQPFVYTAGTLADEEQQRELYSKWAEFILRFMFVPKSINVTETVSNSCGSSDAGGIWQGGLVCHHGGGEAMIDAWKDFYGNEFSSLVNVDDYLSIVTLPSYTHAIVFDYSTGVGEPIREDRRASHTPPPAVVTSHNVAEGQFLSRSNDLMIFPLEAIVNNIDEIVEMLVDNSCVFGARFNNPITCVSFAAYMLGGNIPAADDGLNALSPNRRHGAPSMTVPDPELHEKFLQIFHDASDGEAVTGDNFPGSICHNHASAVAQTPLKSDWTKLCNPEWSKEKKEEECISFQEASFGTQGLKKLERIHSDVDPNRLFECYGGVGYASDDRAPPSSASKNGFVFSTFVALAGMFFLM